MKSKDVSNGWREDKLVDWNDSIEQLLKTTERSLNDKKSMEETSLINETKCRNYYDDMPNGINRISSSIKNPKALVFSIREHLASYQESNGIPRTEYPFTDLVAVMGQITARSLVALLYVVINVAPIAEVIEHFEESGFNKSLQEYLLSDTNKNGSFFSVISLHFTIYPGQIYQHKEYQR